jgi:hypothetical protein
MATYKTLAIVDDVNTCDCCGKTNLKLTVAMERDDGEVLHFGSVCATRHSGRDIAAIKSEAHNVYAAKTAEARAEFDRHPARIAYEVKIMQAIRAGIPAGRAFREYLGDTVAAERAARVTINAKYGVFLA